MVTLMPRQAALADERLNFLGLALEELVGDAPQGGVDAWRPAVAELSAEKAKGCL
jgi:hypothetical protein